MRKIILASASHWRREILEKSGLPFTVEISNFEEDQTLRVSPSELAEILAVGKAEAVAILHSDALIIGADVLADLDGEVLGKPHTSEKAIETLTKLSGRSHLVHTGYCIIDTNNGQQKSGTVTSKVTFRALSPEEIRAYVQTGESLQAAGAYTIQTGAAGFATRIEGDFFAIIGLPLATILHELKAFGVSREFR